MIAGPYRSPEPCLLAERARTAHRGSSCCLCPRPVRPGQRVADVVGGRGPAHLGCVGKLTAGEPR
jgi:hypothetical protein